MGDLGRRLRSLLRELRGPFPAAPAYRVARRLRLDKAYLAAWRTPAFFRAINWRNRAVWAGLAAGRPLAERARLVVEDLRRQGYARAEARELLPAGALDELASHYEALLAAYRASPAARSRDDGTFAHAQSYVGIEPVHRLRPLDPTTRFVLVPVFTEIAAAYLQMAPRFRDVNVWYTNPYRGPRVGPQLFHRDAHDHVFFKVTVFLSDYRAEHGAMEYWPGTHAQGPLRHVLQSARGPSGVADRYDDAQVEAAIGGATPRVTFEGGLGTLYFFDTSGLHRSGYDPIGGRKYVSLAFNTSADWKGSGCGIDPEATPADDPLLAHVFAAR